MGAQAATRRLSCLALPGHVRSHTQAISVFARLFPQACARYCTGVEKSNNECIDADIFQIFRRQT